MSTIVVIIQGVFSTLDSVSDLMIIDIGRNILDVVNVLGVVVDLMICLVSDNILGVAIEVQKVNRHLAILI